LVNDSVTIYLKVVDRAPAGDTDSASFPSPPPFVREHDVPIFKPEFASMIEGGYLEDFLKIQTSLDMTTQQIIPFIDGFRHVKRISYEVDVDINLVKICLQNLLQFGYILIIPIFLYSNVYVATEDLDRLTSETKLWGECREFVAKEKNGQGGKPQQIRPATEQFESVFPEGGSDFADFLRRLHHFLRHEYGHEDQRFMQPTRAEFQSRGRETSHSVWPHSRTHKMREEIPLSHSRRQSHRHLQKTASVDDGPMADGRPLFGRDLLQDGHRVSRIGRTHRRRSQYRCRHEMTVEGMKEMLMMISWERWAFLFRF